MQANINWYQVNPHYFQQIVDKQGWLEFDTTNFTVFELIKFSLDRISEIGCNGLWIMPFYKTGEVNKKGFGSPYAVREYEINPEWGTEEQLRDLVSTAHSRGFKVIGEYVPNHLAPDSPFLESSRDIYYLNNDNQPYFDQNWTDTVKLNHSNYLVQAYTAVNLGTLSKRYGLDGFRLDMAHYPFYDANATEVKSGNGDPKFWENVLASNSLEGADLQYIAEVYDDKSKDLYGYYDHFRLISEGMTVYEKKSLDILSDLLRYQDFGQNSSEAFYKELYIQAQIAYQTGRNIENWPFMRILSNHDDCPAIRLYGSIDKYILATQLLSCLPGQIMVYSGDEYGLSQKPSVTGIESEHESKDIEFLPKSEQQKVRKTIQDSLKMRSNEYALERGRLLCLIH